MVQILTVEEQHEDDNVDNAPYSMTEETLRERELQINNGRYITQLYAALTACVASISQGTVLGWSAPAVSTITHKVSQDNTMTLQNFALISSLAPLGCCLGVIVFTYFNVKVGPRKTMLLQAPFLFTTWIALSLVHTLELAYAGRFFTGFFSCSYMTCGETLLQDCVHKKNLRHMFVMYRSSVFVGILLAYFIGFLWTDRLYFTAICAVVVGIHFVMLFLAPESPVFLYEKHPKLAEKSLKWYRGTANIFMEMREIKKDSELRNVDPIAYKYMLYAKVVMKGLLIVLGLVFFQVCTGYYVLMFYNLDLFKSAWRDITTQNTVVFGEFEDALILGFVFLISKIVALRVHLNTPYGVKKPLYVSGVCCGATLILTSVYTITKTFFPLILRPHVWFTLLSSCCLIISYELGLSSYPDIILVNYMPHQVYPRAKLIVNCVHWFLCFLFIQFYMPLQEASGHAEVMTLMLATCCLGSIAFTSYFVVEFKDQTLVQIQLKLGGNPIGSRGAYGRREEII